MRTDRHEVNSRFSQFCERAYKITRVDVLLKDVKYIPRTSASQPETSRDGILSTGPVSWIVFRIKWQVCYQIRVLHPLNPYHPRRNFTVSPLSRLPDNGWVSPYSCWKTTATRCLWDPGSGKMTEWFIRCWMNTYQGWSASKKKRRSLRIVIWK